MQRSLFLFVNIALFIGITYTFPIVKHKTEYVTANDAFNFLTQYGYDPCNRTTNSNAPRCQSTLESMLKTFQVAYHLPVTEELDTDTLKLMNAPRCTLPDYPLAIMDRTKLWSLNRTLLWKLGHHNFSYDRTIMLRQIQESFNDWTKYTDLRFREASGTETADFDLAFVFGEHGDGSPFDDTQSGQLGHAFLPWQRNRGQIHFHATENWTDKYDLDGYNLRLVATHEIGHSLGLEHSYHNDSIMHPLYQLIQPSNILPARDQNEIQNLYGSKTVTNTTSNSTKECTRPYLPQGDTYEGQYKECMKHGRGTYTFADGRKYIGSWIKDKKSGQGTFSWPSGNQYKGTFKRDKRHKHGTYTFADRRRYVGHWIKDRKSGQGIFSWPNGNKYEGEFKNDARHGNGTYIFHDGRKYVGDWANDKKNGRGTFSWPNGIQYEVQYKDDKQSGPGKYIYHDDYRPIGNIFRDPFQDNWNRWTDNQYGEQFRDSTFIREDVDTDLIADEEDAQEKCPEICRQYEMKWHGHWFTKIRDIMSTCTCRVS